MKAISLVVAGIVLGMAVMAGATYKAPVVQKDSEIVLGHRIGPAGQEMLVIK